MQKPIRNKWQIRSLKDFLKEKVFDSEKQHKTHALIYSAKIKLWHELGCKKLIRSVWKGSCGMHAVKELHSMCGTWTAYVDAYEVMIFWLSKNK